MRRFLELVGASVLLGIVGAALYVGLSSTLNIPNTFSSGQIIQSAQMNANFQAIRSVVNNLTTRTRQQQHSRPRRWWTARWCSRRWGQPVDSSKIVDGSVALADLAL
jgi:hypothetical protein